MGDEGLEVVDGGLGVDVGRRVSDLLHDILLSDEKSS